MESELRKKISTEINKFSFLNLITFFMSMYCLIMIKDMNSFIKESYNSIEINDNVLKSEIEEIYNNLKNKSDINFKSGIFKESLQDFIMNGSFVDTI